MRSIPIKNDICKQIEPSRIDYADIAKGILITLVVVGHAWRAVYNNGILHNAEIYYLVDHWIYAFHMPAFFFLSGLFAMQSAHRTVRAFMAIKLRTIAYPYLLWSTFQSILQVMLSGSTTSTITIVDILRIPFAPVMQFWFLYALFIIFLVFILLRQVTTSPLIFFGIGIILFTIIRTGYVPSFLPVIYLANNFIYFATGILFSDTLPSYPYHLTRHIQSFFTILISLFLTCFISWGSGKWSLPMSNWIAPLCAIPGITLTLLTAMLLKMKLPLLADVFEQLGRRSLEIFVAHTIFSAGFRIISVKFLGNNSLSFHLTGAILAGLLGPCLLIYTNKWIQVRYLFVWPENNYSKKI